MKKNLGALLIVLLMTGCSTLSVNVDYDESFDFSKAQKFTVLHEYKVSENSLQNDRIIQALKNNLIAKNYTNATEDTADLIFVFYTDVKDKTQINQDNYRIGFGFGSRHSGMMMSTSGGTSTYKYTEGTLVVDALHPKTKKIVWRAIATKELGEKSTPREKTEAINKIINKVMEKFPIRANTPKK